MKFITRIQKTTAHITAITFFYFLTSCGSYHYVGMYDDGIYSNSEAEEYISTYQSEAPENEVGNSYYKDYFKGKVNEMSYGEATVFTDIDKYDGNYDSHDESEENYAGWGQNSNSDVIENIQSRPNYGIGWGWNGGWNNWGWNLGWNNWRWNQGWNNWGWNIGWNNWSYPSLGFWDPFYYNGWNTPFWGGYGFIQPYYVQNIAFTNGYRNSGYRTNIISNRSALGTVSRVRSKNTIANPTRSRSYTSSRPTRTVRASNDNLTTTRATRQTSTRSSRSAVQSRTSKAVNRPIRSSRASSINSSHSVPRSSSYSKSMSRPSAPRLSGSRSRSGGGTLRPKRN